MLESPQRKLGDVSDPTYHQALAMNVGIPPAEAGGCFRSDLPPSARNECRNTPCGSWGMFQIQPKKMAQSFWRNPPCGGRGIVQSQPKQPPPKISSAMQLSPFPSYQHRLTVATNHRFPLAQLLLVHACPQSTVHCS